MTGLELLPRVREMLPDLPVIMIKVYGDAATLRRAKEAGAHDVYDKPIDFAALKVEIDQRLAARGLLA
jgi:DNA-binding NtrC family response regulator